eukprot:1142242-Pelagomonas_calceolata.AAC.1
MHTHCTTACLYQSVMRCARTHTNAHTHVTTAHLYHQGVIPANPQAVAVNMLCCLLKGCGSGVFKTISCYPVT